MRLSPTIKAGLITLFVVFAALAGWISLRADNLVNLSKDLDPGFLVPQTSADAIRIGLTIWIPISIVLGLVSSLAYYFMASRWHWRAWQFALIPIGLTAVISAGAFASGMAFAVEALGEMTILTLGFGVLMPVLARIKAE
jgi:sterol desaturase/sphingolipid hydroxylase (fatty acid hydroxylase superfamily)